MMISVVMAATSGNFLQFLLLYQDRVELLLDTGLSGTIGCEWCPLSLPYFEHCCRYTSLRQTKRFRLGGGNAVTPAIRNGQLLDGYVTF